MAVTLKRNDDALELEITKGDKEKLSGIMENWKFKDFQSLMRFIASVMILTNDHDIWIKNENGVAERVKPSEHLLKDNS